MPILHYVAAVGALLLLKMPCHMLDADALLFATPYIIILPCRLSAYCAITPYTIRLLMLIRCLL